MNFVAFDFSINSPGICIWNGDLHFISHPREPQSKKDFEFYENLGQVQGLELKIQNNFTIGENFSNHEMSKLLRYQNITKKIIELIKPYINSSLIIGFEGLSYGSKTGTNNIIDIAAATAILKLELLKKFKPKEILTVSPSTIKKHAGKGNLNKLEVYQSFIMDPFQELTGNPFFEYAKKIEIYKQIPKPIDDLIDAYFLNNLMRSYEKKDH